jgi:hypothetical protein
MRHNLHYNIFTEQSKYSHQTKLASLHNESWQDQEEKKKLENYKASGKSLENETKRIFC